MMGTITTLNAALARIAELETELATRPAPRAKRLARAVQPECQYCGDTKTDKLTFGELPLCADWKPCASRIRSAAKKGIVLDPKRLPGWHSDRMRTSAEQLYRDRQPGGWVAELMTKWRQDADKERARIDAAREAARQAQARYRAA